MQGGLKIYFRVPAILAVFAMVTATLPAASLESVKKFSRDYFTLDSIQEFYGFERSGAGNTNSPFLFKSPYGTMELVVNDRDCWIDGHRAWLSFPLIHDSEHGYLLSEIDVTLLLDPVLRPEETVPRKKVRGVVIDPGHGGADRGARDSSGYSEKTAALDTAQRLKSKLESDGLNVVMTRDRDIFIPLSQRSRIANDYPDHIFVSIHYNSVHVRSANGIETFSLTPRGAPSTSAGGRTRRSDFERYDGNRHDPHNAVLMNLMHRELMTHHTERGDRGLKRARFLVLREVKIPGVLVEGGFMSNTLDAPLIRSSSYREKVANALHRAIRSYVALMNRPQVEDRHRLTRKPEPPEPAPAKPIPEKPASEPEPESKPEAEKSAPEPEPKPEPEIKKPEAEPEAKPEKQPELDTEGPPILRPKPPQPPELRGNTATRAEKVAERLRQAVGRSIEEDEAKEEGEEAAPDDSAKRPDETKESEPDAEEGEKANE